MKIKKPGMRNRVHEKRRISKVHVTKKGPTGSRKRGGNRDKGKSAWMSSVTSERVLINATCYQIWSKTMLDIAGVYCMYGGFE